MFLSKIKLNTENLNPGKAARLLSTSVYKEHGWIWNLFPEQTNKERDFLYRRFDNGAVLQYYILSKRKPLRQKDNWEISTKEFAPIIQKGSRLSFHLRVNPVVTRKINNDSKKRKRDDVFMDALYNYKKIQKLPASKIPTNHEIMVESGMKWIFSRMENYGFVLDKNELLVEAYHRLEGLKNKGKQKIKFGVLDYSGILTVQNTDKFYNALYNGIGKAKSFGCGLLLIRRA